MIINNNRNITQPFSLLQVLSCDANSSQMRDLLFVHDVLQKVTKLKLVTSPTTVQGQMTLSRFPSLRQLELLRVPPHLVAPMKASQAAELEVLEAHRCLTGIKVNIDKCNNTSS